MIESIVLAGGQGTRLRAILGDLPKPMADIAGRPFLWWLMTRLHQQGVGRVILSVGHRSEVIEDYFGTTFDGMEISYAFEKERLGTGGAIKYALKKARAPQVVVLNGDSYVDVSLPGLLGKFASANTDLAVAVKYLKDSGRYGSVVIEEETDIITGFVEKKGTSAGYINAGVYCLQRDLFLKYAAPLSFSFERDFLPNQLGAIKPLALKRVGAFIDIGVPEDYALARTLIPTLAARIAHDPPCVVDWSPASALEGESFAQQLPFESGRNVP
jgi:D-glycero-alpha-D-manno-heptose 1-phosphate guanylyltransferase